VGYTGWINSSYALGKIFGTAKSTFMKLKTANSACINITNAKGTPNILIKPDYNLIRE